jgi:hypothetical protein
VFKKQTKDRQQDCKIYVVRVTICLCPLCNIRERFHYIKKKKSTQKNFKHLQTQIPNTLNFLSQIYISLVPKTNSILEENNKHERYIEKRIADVRRINVIQCLEGKTNSRL